MTCVYHESMTGTSAIKTCRSQKPNSWINKCDKFSISPIATEQQRANSLN